MRSSLVVLCSLWMVIQARSLSPSTELIFAGVPKNEAEFKTTFSTTATETKLNLREHLSSIGLSTPELGTELMGGLRDVLEREQSDDAVAREEDNQEEEEQRRLNAEENKKKIEVDNELFTNEEGRLRAQKEREQIEEEKRLQAEERLREAEEKRKEMEQERLRAERKRRKEEQERLRAEEKRRREKEKERLRAEQERRKEAEQERLRREKERRKVEEEKLKFVKHTPYISSAPATFVGATFTSMETTLTHMNTRIPKSETLVPNLNATARTTTMAPATFDDTTFTSVETNFTTVNTKSPNIETVVPNVNAVGWTTSAPKEQCGQRTRRNGRIVGGDDTFPGEFPWAVSVRIVNIHHCGGTIINKYWVLTAAHCVKRYAARYFRVRPGILSIYGNKYLPKWDINLKEIVVHPDFGQPRRYSNDVALLKLKRAMTFNLLTQPICLPSPRDEDFDGWNATVVGWGRLDEGEKERPTLMQRVTVPILNNTICAKWYSEDRNSYIKIDDYQICAGYKEGGKDACEGDSGGPLVTKDKDNQFIIVGVVSAGIGCARENLPGLYSRVSVFVPWIRQVTGELKYSKMKG